MLPPSPPSCPSQKLVCGEGGDGPSAPIQPRCLVRESQSLAILKPYETVVAGGQSQPWQTMVGHGPRPAMAMGGHCRGLMRSGFGPPFSSLAFNTCTLASRLVSGLVLGSRSRNSWKMLESQIKSVYYLCSRACV